MSGSLWDGLEGLAASYGDGSRLALLFDYDGTLLPIGARSSLGILERKTRERLERLASTPSVFVGVLSGRRLDELKESVGLDGVYYAGTNGLELDLCGVRILHPGSDSAASLVMRVADDVRAAVTAYSGAWVEHKGLGLTVHYRDVGCTQIDALLAGVAKAVKPFSGRVRVLNGPMAVEIVADLGWTKESALTRIVEWVGGNTVRPLYAGHEENDAEAMMAATARGGVAIGVGPEAPAAAQHHLPDPAALGCCLDTLQELLTTRDANLAR